MTDKETANTTESVSLEATASGIPDLNKPAVAARFAEVIAGGNLGKLSPAQQTMFLAGLGAYIGVKPELGDLMIYQGKPYITISGYRRIAHNTGLLNGVQVEPASSRDFLRFGAEQGEHLWVARVHKRGCSHSFLGWGYVRKNDRNPVSKTHPQEMAKKRALYDALRLAFPPNEIIGAIHMKYIDEAEDIAKKSSLNNVLTNNDYPEEAEIEGIDEAVADASTDAVEQTAETAAA